MRIAHPTIDELEFANTVFILFGGVVSGVDVFEPVAALFESFQHMDH
jgi:hypothetical protein